MNARRRVLLVVSVLALAATGCGGDDSSDAVAETTAVEETACPVLSRIGAKFSEFIDSETGDLGRLSDAFDEIAEQVPDEIEADYELIAENFSEIAEALADVDFQDDFDSGQVDTEALAKLQEVGRTLDSAEVREASASIETWVTANC